MVNGQNLPGSNRCSETLRKEAINHTRSKLFSYFAEFGPEIAKLETNNQDTDGART